MKSSLTFILIFLFTTHCTLAQTPQIQWQKSLGGSGADSAKSIQQTIDGGYVVAGSSSSNDGDVSGNNGNADIWVVKLNASGSIQWEKSLGGSLDDIGFSIQQVTDGGYIVSGSSRSNDGDVSGNNGYYDFWMIKLNASGGIQWQKSLGGSGADGGNSVQQTTDGGYIVAGYSNSNNGDVSGNHGMDDFWVVKLNASGSIQWQKSLGGSLDETGFSIQQTTDGGYIVVGYSWSNDGDVDGNHGNTDYWVVKLNTSGNIQWQKSLGGSGADLGNSIQQTIDGGYVVAGSSSSNDGDVSGNHGNDDLWVVKLNTSGDIQWQKSLGGSSTDVGNSIQQTIDGGYLVGGYSWSNDGDVSGNHGNSDYWVVKLNTSGNLLWQKSLGGSSYDIVRSVQQTTDGNYIITGGSASNDGDVSGNHGMGDFWVVKLEDCSLDLYIKDSPEEDGTEPNIVTEHMWNSEDIWVRNIDDGGLTHENPEYNSNGQPNFIYVRVINNSCTTSIGDETLAINWAKANTALAWPENWDGSLQNTGGYDLGGELPSVSIPIVGGEDEVIVKVPWIVPNPDNYTSGAGSDNPWHFCLLARIDATNDPLTFPFTSNPNIMVRNNNNQAWKNITVVDLLTATGPGIFSTSATVMVANPSNTSRNFFLELQKETNEGGKAIFEEAEVTLEMDDVLYAAWERGGNLGEKLEDIPSEEKRKIVKGDNAILDNIVFEPKEMGLLTLNFNFLTEEITNKGEYVYHLIQKDAITGEVLGGETYVIKKEARPTFIAGAGDDEEIDLNETIIISAEDINEPAIYNWYDSEGNLVYQGKDLTVTASLVDKYKLEVIAISDGFKDYTEVEVKLKPNRIEAISPNPSSNNININYKLNGVNSAYLLILGYNGISYNYILDINNDQININIGNYPQGIYTVALVCNGEIVDAMNLVKQ